MHTIVQVWSSFSALLLKILDPQPIGFSKCCYLIIPTAFVCSTLYTLIYKKKITQIAIILKDVFEI